MLKSDKLLLANVFENFQDICPETYQLNAARFQYKNLFI